MKPGNLVKITRASILVPKDTLALVIGRVISQPPHGDEEWIMYSVKPMGLKASRNNVRRYYARDLELIS